jgi:cobalt-zinc-cadmium resistance protein CzcA
VQAAMRSVLADLRNAERTLQLLLNSKVRLTIAVDGQPLLLSVAADTLQIANNPQASADRKSLDVALARVAVEKAKVMPDLTLGYSQQLIVSGFNPANINRTYAPGTRIAGIQLGIALPIFNGANRARIQAEQLSAQATETRYEATASQLKLHYAQELELYHKYMQIVNYYSTEGLKQAEEQLRIANVSFNLGEIGYIEYIQNTSSAIKMKLSHLEAVNQANQSAIQIQFLKGE